MEVTESLLLLVEFLNFEIDTFGEMLLLLSFRIQFSAVRRFQIRDFKLPYFTGDNLFKCSSDLYLTEDSLYLTSLFILEDYDIQNCF